ncbi:MAG: acetyl-CoA carboxylase carboxyltransferase subunit alpha [Planctomycetota bacterium]|nr:acetyl-CoA carboxylase carboxyltransferase subunit alpha [Planctomycetota bacterium]
MTTQILEFEQPIYELKDRIAEFEAQSDNSSESTEKLRELRKELTDLTRSIYSNLTPWQTVKVARHADRPYTVDYLSLVFDEFVELHGDKFFGDDRAVRAGFAKLDGEKLMVIGHQKGRNLKERQESYFGCAHPEGYRKAMLKMRMAEKYGLPVVCFIDTPGAYPGIGAEERGQAQVIAESMFEMSQLKTPVICVVIGEGGSGGALGIGVGNRVAMLENSYYSVISPEGCAGILWKSGQHAEKAADALKFTASYLKKFGVIDDIIEEPLGGAHCDHHQMSARLKRYLIKTMKDLSELTGEQLVNDRYERFRKIGVFTEQNS